MTGKEKNVEMKLFQKEMNQDSIIKEVKELRKKNKDIRRRK